MSSMTPMGLLSPLTPSRFAESPHAADVVAEDAAAVVGVALLKEFFLEGIGLLLHVVAVELGDEQCGRFSLDEETVAVLGAVVAAELEYLAVHEFDGHGVVAQGHEVGLIALREGVAVGAEHHLLLGRERVEGDLDGGDEAECALAAADEFAEVYAVGLCRCAGQGVE